MATGVLAVTDPATRFKLNDPRDVALVGTSIVVTEHAQRRLVVVNNDAVTETIDVPNRPIGLAADGTTIFFSAFDGRIYRRAAGRR